MSRNITGDKMFSHLNRVLGDHRPITADIFLTNYCNNKCPYCTYGRWELETGTHSMSFDEFSVYATRLRNLGVQGFILTGGGEPTVCRDFDKITKWLEEQGIHYGINTNFNVLKYIKPDYLKVSLDGWNEDSYEASRGVRKYAQVRKNIKAYADWKRDESPETSLGIQRVVTSPDDVKLFYDANYNLPVDYIVFRPVESTRGQMYKQVVTQTFVEDCIEEVKHIARGDSRVTLNFKWNMLHEQEETCTAQWAQIAVNERGQVMYCCHKPYEIVGFVLDEDILEKKAEARTNMCQCDIPCRMTAPNKFVAQAEKVRKDAWFI